MKAKIIICVFAIVAFAVAGCEEEQTLSELHWDVIIEEKREEGYQIASITMKKKDEKFLHIIDSNYDYEIAEPNEDKILEDYEVERRKYIKR